MFKIKTKLVNEPVVVYLVTDPHIANANTEEALAEYIRTGDSSSLVIPEEASKVLMRPLTPKGLDVAKDRMPPANHLGRHLHESLERNYDLKQAKHVFESVVSNKDSSEKERLEALELYSRAEADILDALSDKEAKALIAHRKWVEQFGLELMLESLVQFPFIDEEGELFVPKDKEQTLSYLREISPKSISDKVIAELTTHAYRLSYLSNEGKA